MKKIITIILNVLSIISALALAVVTAFCAYDWIRLANTAYAYTVDFWWAMGYYVNLLLIFAPATLVFALPNFLINRKEETDQKTKKLSLVLSIVSAVVILISIVLCFFTVKY